MSAELPSQHVRERRLAAGLTQVALASRADVSRQTLAAIEAGRAGASVAVALRLARALGIGVDDLFALADDASAAVCLPDGEEAPPEPRRAIAGIVDGRTVVLPLDGDAPGALVQPADGLVARRGDAVGLERFDAAADLGANVLVVGCAPVMALWAGRVNATGTASRLRWRHAASGAAVDHLVRREAHVAGAHLRGEGGGDFNVPIVRARFPTRSMVVVNLVRWDAGLAVAPGNPLGIADARDLARPGVRLVNRPRGAGARHVLDDALARAGVAAADVVGYDRLAPTHGAVASMIALGGADAGVTVRGTAIAHGLDFIPLVSERFDLIVPRDVSELPAVARALDVLDSPGFRRELAAVAGYDARQTGHVIAELSA